MKTKDRLKELRKKKHLAGQEVANGCDMSYKVYQTYESGIHNPGVPALIKFADFYRVSVDYLLGREAPTKHPLAFLNLNADGKENTMKTYYERICRLCELKGITLEELSEETGISMNHFKRWNKKFWRTD